MKISKIVLVGLLVLLSHASLAADVTSKEVRLTNNNLQESAQLSKDYMRIIYKTEYYQDTCSREVYSHTDTSCSSEPDYSCSSSTSTSCHTETRCPQREGTLCREETVCNSTPTESCSTTYREVCTDHPVYVTEYYECTKSREVPIGEELVTHLEADVIVKITPAKVGLKIDETLIVTTNPSQAQLDVVVKQQSGKTLLVRKDELQVQEGNKQTEVRGILNIEAHDIADVISSVKAGISNLNGAKNILSFDLNKLTNIDHISLNLELKRNKFLGAETIFKNRVPKDALVLKDNGSGKVGVSIDLNKLYLYEDLRESTKYEVKVTLQHNSSENVLNPQVLPENLKSESKVKFKIDKLY